MYVHYMLMFKGQFWFLLPSSFEDDSYKYLKYLFDTLLCSVYSLSFQLPNEGKPVNTWKIKRQNCPLPGGFINTMDLVWVAHFQWLCLNRVSQSLFCREERDWTIHFAAWVNLSYLWPIHLQVSSPVVKQQSSRASTGTLKRTSELKCNPVGVLIVSWPHLRV